MEIYTGKRGEGKTTKAVLLSVETQMPIVCVGVFHKAYIKDIAKELGVLNKLPEPILPEEKLDRITNSNEHKGLIIDELEPVLNILLGDKVNYATISSETAEIKSLEDFIYEGYLTEIWKKDKLIVTNYSSSLEEAVSWYKKYYADICNGDKRYKMFIYKNK